MNAGDVVKIPLPTASLDSHPWVIISDPSQSEEVIMVNFTSWRADKDQACVLEQGEHPLVTHKTCVYYVGSKKVLASDIQSLIDQGEISKLQSVSDNLLARIRAGVANSRMSLDHAQFLEAQGVVTL